MMALKGYSWPGNIRQLQNVIERAVVISEGPVVTMQHLPLEVQGRVEAVESSGQPSSVALACVQASGPGCVRNGSSAIAASARQWCAPSPRRGGTRPRLPGCSGWRSTFLSRLKKHGLS